MSNPSGERTEQATPKRMQEVRREGRLSSSRDLPGWLSVAAAVLVLPAVLQSASAETQRMFAGVARIIRRPDADAAARFMGESLTGVLPIIAPLLAASVVGVIVGALLAGGIHPRRFKVSAEHFHLVKGAGRMFGRQALWEGAKALLKTGVVGAALAIAAQAVLPLMTASAAMPVQALLGIAVGAITGLMQAAIVAGLALGALDVLVVRRRNRQHTMMTMQEIKDEAKHSEGDPLVKQQRRSRQLAMSRNRMMSAIGSADVVLVNPTHVAVALKYEPGKSAPRVVAKGSGEVAAKIRERAADLRVPMVQDVPLARALHAACEIGQEIPEELYGAVARVLAFVMALKRRGAALGVHRLAS